MRFLTLFLLVFFLPTNASSEPSSDALQDYFLTTSLEDNLTKHYEKFVKIAASKRLLKIASAGGEAVKKGRAQEEQDELYKAGLKKLNLLKKKADEKFNAKKIINDLHAPYYKKHYNEEELKVLGAYYRDVVGKLETVKDKSKLKALANVFKETSAGKKYINLREQEIKLMEKSLEIIVSLIEESEREVFN